jgi:hypothetical protein
MDWHIKTIARKSSLTATPFKPGERVVCLIFKVPNEDELGRVDLLESEVDAFEMPGDILGRWTRIVKDPDDEAASKNEIMSSAEDFFFSLFEVEHSDTQDTSDMLKHLLSLMLERKRVLRAVGPRQTEGQQAYRHVKTKQELLVPVVDISTELMLKIQDTIGDIML